MINAPGTTNSNPAASPPLTPCIRQPIHVASCWASGPGNKWQKFKAWRYCSSSIHLRSSTNSRCISAICPAGPPKLRQPIRVKTRTSSENSGTGNCDAIITPRLKHPENRTKRQHLGEAPDREVALPRWKAVTPDSFFDASPKDTVYLAKMARQPKSYGRCPDAASRLGPQLEILSSGK